MRQLVLALMILLGSVSVGDAEDLNNVIYLTCYDGDTCSFDIMMPAVFGVDMRVRLAGIDTPELANSRCAKEKVLAIAARDYLRSQLQQAQVVLHNVFRDKYFRIEATVIANGVNLNQAMIEKGMAVPYNGTGVRKDWCL